MDSYSFIYCCVITTLRVVCTLVVLAAHLTVTREACLMCVLLFKDSYILVGIGLGLGRIRRSMVWCCIFHGVNVPCRVVWCVEWCVTLYCGV